MRMEERTQLMSWQINQASIAFRGQFAQVPPIRGLWLVPHSLSLESMEGLYMRAPIKFNLFSQFRLSFVG